MEALFTKLEGYREVNVKVFWEPDAELQKLMIEDADLAAQRDRCGFDDSNKKSAATSTRCRLSYKTNWHQSESTL